jgi:hypothetical protein
MTTPGATSRWTKCPEARFSLRTNRTERL